MGMNTSSISWKRSPGQGRRAYTAMADINVTPFVDVMLVLLIVFMVTAPLLTAGVSVDLPDSEAPAIKEEDDTPVEISITKDGVVYLGETEVKEERLVMLLTSMTNRDLERRIFIRGDQSLSYGKVMGLIGAINKAGFKKVALISESVPSRSR